MSKNGVLVCYTTSNRKNIGDYIQSVAQEQFWDKVDCYVEREELNGYRSDEPTNVIMNGWFMIKPENYPPHLSINPFYISYHIDRRMAKRLLTDKKIEHFKKYEPIGCRDTDTMKLLREYGVNSYFSGCLTTTLCLRYKADFHDGKPIFVDPYYEVAGTRRHLYDYSLYAKNLWWTIKHWRKVNKFIDHFNNEFWTWYGKLSRKWERRICASAFYESYRSAFTDETLYNSEYVTHNVESTELGTNDEWMEYARELIRKYARAKFVVTSRIHCALPCLGVETPVIFVETNSLHDNSLRDASRFGGLIEMFNVISWNKRVITPKTPTMKKLFELGKIALNSNFENLDAYKPYRDDMIKRTRDFVESTK